MDGARPRLRRFPFGYQKRSVDEYVSQRESVLRERERRLQETRTRMAELEANLRLREHAIDQLKAQMESIGDDPTESSHDYASRLTATLMTEELQQVLGAAQEAATRIIERADLTTQERLEEAEQLWREVEAQVSTLSSWRDVVAPVSESTQSRIAHAQAQIDDVPERIRAALVPMAEAIAEVQAQIAELARVAAPPDLSKPPMLHEVFHDEHDDVPDVPSARFFGAAGPWDHEQEGADPDSRGAASRASTGLATLDEEPARAPSDRPDEAPVVVETIETAEAPPAEGGLPEETTVADPVRVTEGGDTPDRDVVILGEASSERRSPSRRWVGAAAILVLLVAAGAGGYFLANRSPSNQAQFNEFIAQTGTQLVAFTPSSGRQLSIAYRPGQREAWIVGRNLPTPTHRQVYELWYFPTGSETPVPAGTFLPDEGTVLQRATIGTSISTLAVTVEPRGGSKQPTTTPIFVVKV